MKAYKKISILLTCTALLLTGCNTSSKDTNNLSSEEYKPYGKYEEAVEYTIGRGQRDLNYMPEGDTIEDNPASRFLTEETNIIPKVAWETAEYNQKIALSISTGDIPDVMVVGHDIYQEMLENDLLADLTEVYEKAASPHTKERIDTWEEDVLKICSDEEGKLRAIPMPYSYYVQTLTWIRKDWLDEIGAEVPRTMDEINEVAKQFVEHDLAKEGQTYALTLGDYIAGYYGAEFEAGPFFHQYNAFPRQWVNVDGQAAYGSIQPEMKEGLKLLRDWYEEGLLDNQFAVRTSEERSGLLVDNVGIHFGPWWIAQFGIAETIKNDPDADWIAIPAPETPEGEVITLRGNPILRYVVVNKDYEHPEAIMRALNNVTDFNYSLTDEAIEFRDQEFGEDTYFPWYYAPIDYKLESAEANKEAYLALDKAVEGDESELPPHLKGSLDLIKNYLEKGTEDVKGWSEYKIYFDGLKTATAPNTVYNQMAFYDKTKGMETKWANLEKLENESFLKIIMGEEDLDYFDEFVQQWLDQGGEEITEEVNEEVAKRQ